MEIRKGEGRSKERRGSDGGREEWKGGGRERGWNEERVMEKGRKGVGREERRMKGR
jgi:hypothetical protein